MSTSFSGRLSAGLAILVMSVALAGIAACGKGGSSSAVCAARPEPDGGFTLDQTFAIGSASGPGVSASFCNVGIQLSGPASAQSGRLLFGLDTAAPFASIDVQLPAGAVGGTLTGVLQVGAPAAGVYKSSDAQLCGALTFSYGTPTTPGAKCNAGPGGACPAGCTSTFICADAAAEPCCVPLAKTFVYQATAATSCTGGTQGGMGSWTLTLTSVAPYPGAATQFGEDVYVAHGTLTAVLKGTADTTDSLDVSLTF